jgi:molybdate transport system substrate-binding protein
VPTFGRKRAVLTIAVLTIAGLSSVAARAETLTVAVASNFAEPLREIAQRFDASTGHEVRVSPGSSGKLYAQIINGAPYDVFLSADARRPKMLELESKIVAGSRTTYAIGQLVIWSRDIDFADDTCLDGLEKLGKKKLAIANPLLAPYGIAAKQYLLTRGLWDGVQNNLVLGENVAQTLQYAASGGASIAIVAQSQIRSAEAFGEVCVLPIAADDHEPVLQQLVQLVGAANADVAAEFLEFLRAPETRAIISNYGYLLPEVK